jgi:hypothetical protein
MMLFDAFARSFSKDSAHAAAADGNAPRSEVPDWNDLVDLFGGSSFERGLYRVVRGCQAPDWDARIAAAFPQFGHRVTCFGFDWLGRVFAIDPKRLEYGQPGVVMFDPGTGEALIIPRSLSSFHNEELVDYADAALASDFHKRWLSGGGAAPEYDQCVGYQTPLFLGGTDDLENLEVTDIEVYWHLTAQLVLKTRNLPVGTPVGKITLS